MPFYEYRCAQEHVFDARQGFNDEPIAVCPKCGSPAQRVIQPVGVVFKGGGWYATDSRKSSSHTVSAGGETHDDDKASTSTDGGSTVSKEPAPAASSTTTSSPTPATGSGDAAPKP